MKIVVGLGNPGSRYSGTRHNVGFEVIDTLARHPQANSFREKFESLIAEVRWGDDTLLLVKPQTYMNLSGRAVRALLDFYKLSPQHLLVVCDDIHLPLGKLRLRPRGSHGGHNGLRDIQLHLGTEEYPRLRIGVGEPEPGEAVDHVLGRFRASEQPIIAEAIARAAQAVECWAEQGLEAAMNRFNAPDRPAKRSYARSRPSSPSSPAAPPPTSQANPDAETLTVLTAPIPVAQPDEATPPPARSEDPSPPSTEAASPSDFGTSGNPPATS
jgi:PTH1 family peptidyl-tRNA hydrolase